MKTTPRQQTLPNAFARARRAGRLLFFPELLPGFPTHPLAQKALDYAASFDHVVLKVPTPVLGGHPSNTNAILREAHRTALDAGVTTAHILETLARTTCPNFLVVYPDAITPNLSAFLKRCSGTIDSLIFVEGLAGRESTLERLGVDATAVQTLGQRFDLCIARIVYAGYEATFDEPLASSNGFLYLAISNIPGGPAVTLTTLHRAIDRIKQTRNIPIVAGFGIGSFAQARQLAAIDGIDGLTVGSWLYTTLLEQGFDAFKHVFDGLYEALTRSTSVGSDFRG